MGGMEEHEEQNTAHDGARAEDPRYPLSPEEFDAARMARYQRLSLLTLDLAEEAGGAALNAGGSNRDRGPSPRGDDRRAATC